MSISSEDLFPGPSFLSSYHSISLLPFIEKPLESIMCIHCLQSLSSSSLLNPLHSGFYPYYSTKMSLNKVISDFRVAKSNDYSSVLILHDLSTASSIFDHPFYLEILSTKTTSLGFPSSLTVPSQAPNTSSSTSSPRSFLWYFFTQLATSPNVKLLNIFTC